MSEQEHAARMAEQPQQASAPRKHALLRKLARRWAYFWMQRGGLSSAGRLAMWLAALGAPPYYQRSRLANMTPKGFVEPSATIFHPDVRLGKHILIGDRVLIYQDSGGGPVVLGDGVHLYRDCGIQTGAGGSVEIGANTRIQPRCQFSAYKQAINIGRDVMIAPNCAFYPYDHGMEPGQPMSTQPLISKGPIIVEDGAWISTGVIVLANVRIGKGAVIGAGAVVTKDVPDEAIASGSPARVVKMRRDLARAGQPVPDLDQSSNEA
jgi:acetyltransferase-like isoleucine patch superfamily enzyme